MAVNILMPALSPTMTEGKLAKWLVSEGDEVSSGDVLAEIETDKATMEVEVVDEGTVAKLLVAEGTDGVAVNAVIAVLKEDGDSDDDVAASAEAPVSSSKPKDTDMPLSHQAEPEAKGVEETKANTATSSHEMDAHKSMAATGERVKASPLAKRLAKRAGIDLSLLKGTGFNGRIVAADIEDASKSGMAHKPSSAASATAQAIAPQTTAPNPEEIAKAFGLSHSVEPANKMRQTIARRLTESKQNVPHFYLTVDIAMDRLMAVRKEINAGLEASGGGKVSVNDFIIKASAAALKAVPAANASWNGDSIVLYDNAHVSVAVAIEGGLITPVVRLAETKTLSQISTEMKDLAGRAKDGKLKPEEYQGGTFSISNMGMMGVKEFSAVINPPESMILAVGSGEKRPVVLDDGSLSVAMQMSVTLSCDHRVVDGALGAQWLQAFKSFMENPLGMLA